MVWGYRTGSYNNDGAGWSNPSSGGSHTVAPSAAAVLGDLIVVHINCASAGGTAPTFSVSDPTNGTYTQDVTRTFVDGSNNTRASIFSKANVAAGTPTITVAITNTVANFGGMQVAVFSGIATTTPLDTSANNNATSASATSGNVSPATTAASELMVGCYGDNGNGTTLTKGNVAGAASTQAGQHGNDGNNWQGLIEYGDSSTSGGTPAATVTASASGIYGMLAAVYKIASGGGATTYPITVSTTQAQSVSVATRAIYARTVTTTQTQSLNSAKQVNVVRSLSTTQAQSLALGKQIGLTRALAQTQALSLVKAVGLVRSLAQAESVSVTARKVFLLVVSATQAQSLSLVKQARLARAVTQSQSLSLVRQFQLRRTVTQSTLALALARQLNLRLTLTQAQALSLGKLVRLVRSLSESSTVTLASAGGHTYMLVRSVTQAQSLTLTAREFTLPGPAGTAVWSTAPVPGAATHNYQDWPVLIIRPSEPAPPVGDAIWGGP